MRRTCANMRQLWRCFCGRTVLALALLWGGAGASASAGECDTKVTNTATRAVGTYAICGLRNRIRSSVVYTFCRSFQTQRVR